VERKGERSLKKKGKETVGSFSFSYVPGTLREGEGRGEVRELYLLYQNLGRRRGRYSEEEGGGVKGKKGSSWRLRLQLRGRRGR